MTLTVILHIQGGEPVVGEVEAAPAPADTLITIRNARKIDGKDLNFVSETAASLVFPIARLNFVEILSGGEDEEIFGFVRE